MSGFLARFTIWLNTLNRVAFSDVTDQFLWLVTAFVVLLVWVASIAFDVVDRLTASMAFMAMWLGYLTGSSLLTAGRDAHKRTTDTGYIAEKAGLERAKTETAKATREHSALHVDRADVVEATISER